jgi:hypothetical protein
VVKIEAKLDAGFREGQLESHLGDLENDSNGYGLLLLLVPHYRAGEAAAVVSSTFSVTGKGPWRVGGGSAYAVAVISWEDMLSALRAVSSEPFACDLAQFQAMYRVFVGEDVDITGTVEGLAWRGKKEALLEVINRVTRRLTLKDTRLLPMQPEKDPAPMGFRHRYVCRPLGNEYPCFSVGVRVGVRDPFLGH